MNGRDDTTTFLPLDYRRLMDREPINVHMMIRQEITWSNLETETETV